MQGGFQIAAIVALSSALSVAGAGCTYEREGEPELHFNEFMGTPPRGNSMTVCHGYGCQMQNKVTFPQGKIDEFAEIMRKTKRRDTPFEERRAIAYATAAMERHTGEIVGTKADRPGMDLKGPGDPTQLDCVDKSTNMTSYLLILQNNKLLKHHTVGIPIAKGHPMKGWSGWPHWTAILKEKSTGQRFAVDSWAFANGENPAVVEVENWYTRDLEHLPPSQT